MLNCTNFTSHFKRASDVYFVSTSCGHPQGGQSQSETLIFLVDVTNG